MLSKSLLMTYTQDVYARYVIWARDERQLAENYRLRGDFDRANLFTLRADDFAKQATDAMRQLAIMRG